MEPELEVTNGIYLSICIIELMGSIRWVSLTSVKSLRVEHPYLGMLAV